MAAAIDKISKSYNQYYCYHFEANIDYHVFQSSYLRQGQGVINPRMGFFKSLVHYFLDFRWRCRLDYTSQKRR